MRPDDYLDRIEAHARSELCCDFWAPVRVRVVLLDMVRLARRQADEIAALKSRNRRLRRKRMAARRRR